MRFAGWATLLAAASVVSACGDDHDHAHEHQRRAFPSTQLPIPSRPLVWGDVNVIATTDTHGWLLGHQKTSWPEPNYSGDLGDFYSFVAHMKELALEKDVDLILVDSGDVHDGTGLSDGFPAGGVDAHDSNKFLLDLPYDLMAIGNHELYIYANTFDMYTNFVPHLNGRYLSSNVNITVFNKFGEPESVPVGSRSVKFKTRKGRSVTSVGVLYDFTGNDVNTTVQPVAEMVKEEWFAEAIKEEPDFFLLIGHMPVSNDNWPTVFNAIRAVHPTTPMLIFGGHTHIRDCVQYDGRTMALESGRYMETIGWMSANLDGVSKHENISFTRRYLDQNRVTYEYHTTTSNRSFDTLEGKTITEGMLQLADKFDLSFQYGVAPQDYFLDAAPYPSNSSVLTLLVAEAMPYSLTINNTRIDIPNIMITNSGEERFDLYSGPFTKNDQLTTLPFADAFVYIPNIAFSVANQVLPSLNHQGADEKRSMEYVEREMEKYARGEVGMRYRRWLQEMDRRGAEKRAAANLTLGYVTHDSCPGVGDDVAHSPQPFFDAPDFIGSNPPSVSDDTPVDLVFINFIQDQLLEVLNSVQSTKNYTDADVLSYTPTLANAVLGLYAQKFWN
ncbi:hypothetical protein CERSUDRAFT_118376 [Gelatoporia subvermispora B]|uniref:Calcineurin-like phosphoesterase domain-containing protein n=1 Tax=Ceriporiopsis subvermispora (strain B) TaxID=914234 RepID=M2QLF1_CERS8|nr:hypothetical protein CERSUDRAFT_118376 [Gelatoporia subvermispora B]